MMRNMMDTVQEINFAFSYSAKRINQFRTSLEATPHELEDEKWTKSYVRLAGHLDAMLFTRS